MKIRPNSLGVLTSSAQKLLSLSRPRLTELTDAEGDIAIDLEYSHSLLAGIIDGLQHRRLVSDSDFRFIADGIEASVARMREIDADPRLIEYANELMQMHRTLETTVE